MQEHFVANVNYKEHPIAENLQQLKLSFPIKPIEILDGIILGTGTPILIAGPCVIEEENLILNIALRLKEETRRWNIPLIFKASFDKANRTSLNSFRGPGLKEGLRILKMVKDTLNIPVTTDVHLPDQVPEVAEVVDIIQIPAFLCRQTDLVVRSAQTGKAVNIKKGQFLSPEEALPLVEKVRSQGNQKVFITERGTTFGYHRLVVDFVGIVQMRSLGIPVVLDITHSIQQPGSLGNRSGGDWRFAPYLG
ncbi:MAG: 3-deoxy-8-phosphooctulonate synthase, partial [bacterium]